MRKRLSSTACATPQSHTGNPWDNAAVESFFSTLKTECLHRYSQATRLETQAIAFDYIETF